MFDGMFDNSMLPMLEQVVTFTQARHGVLAGNIANLDTPGYRSRDLSPALFQERLKDAERELRRAEEAHQKFLQANRSYSESFDKGELPIPPGRRFAVVTCMDARLDPAKFLGLEEGDAHVIRNAGGVVSDDALRSLIISHWLLGTEEALVIAHTGCGMLTFTNDDLHSKLADETGADATGIDFLPFPDLDDSVRASVERVRSSGNWPPRTTCSSCTVNSISRMPPRESFTSLARSGRPAARLAASSRILRCSWRRPSKTP